jgi:hypothetical protein
VGGFPKDALGDYIFKLTGKDHTIALHPAASQG